MDRAQMMVETPRPGVSTRNRKCLVGLDEQRNICLNCFLPMCVYDGEKEDCGRDRRMAQKLGCPLEWELQFAREDATALRLQAVAG